MADDFTIFAFLYENRDIYFEGLSRLLQTDITLGDIVPIACKKFQREDDYVVLTDMIVKGIRMKGKLYICTVPWSDVRDTVANPEYNELFNHVIARSRLNFEHDGKEYERFIPWGIKG